MSGVEWYPCDTGLFTTSSVDGSVKVWDSNTLTSATTFELGSPVHAHSLSPLALVAGKISSLTDGNDDVSWHR